MDKNINNTNKIWFTDFSFPLNPDSPIETIKVVNEKIVSALPLE